MDLACSVTMLINSPNKPLHATADGLTTGMRICALNGSVATVSLRVQYCDGGPLDQAIRKSRFKRTMVRPISLHGFRFWS